MVLFVSKDKQFSFPGKYPYPPPLLPATGRRYYTDGTLYYQASHGGYWSCQANSTALAQRFYFDSTGFYPNTDDIGRGFSLRCIKI